MNKPATTSEPIHEILARRWSPRAFDPEARIEAGQVRALAEAARWAPSCFGAEPWSYVFCDRHADPDSWERGFPCLAEGNQAWVKNASLLIAAVGRADFEHNGKPNGWHQYDTGAASLSLVIQAESLGLRAHQMGGFDPDKAREAFGIPEGWNCLAMIAVGKQAAAETIEIEDMRNMELAERKRKDLGTIAFAGKWGAGLG